VLLPRRNGRWVSHPICRGKGKVTVRVGNISSRPASATRGRFADLSRRFVSVVVLMASVSALALILHHDYRPAYSGTTDRTEDPAASSSQALPVTDVTPAEDRRYRALSDFVAKRYRVSQDVAYDLVHLAHSTGQQVGLDPLLIIAVIAIESRFNPIAESISGAKGLMQIIPKYHTEKLEEYGGEKAVFDPVANIKVGAQILKEYMRITGNLGLALQMYAGALGDGDDQYTAKVINEQQRLKQIVAPSAASRAGLTRTSATATPPAAPLE